ncbi:MAG: hypothetical protein AAF587_16465 [Bacteroidota bacterium]
MKRGCYISLLLFPLIYFGGIQEGKGQSEVALKNVPNSYEPSIQQNFQATPSHQLQFDAYIDRGKQKVQDLFDYCALLSSTEQRKKWGPYLDEQLITLFLTDSVICFDQPTVSAFVRQSKIQLVSDSNVVIQLLQPFEPYRDGFLAQMLVHYGADNGKKQTSVQVDIHLVRTSQMFGKELLWVWKVLLGNVQKS